MSRIDDLKNFYFKKGKNDDFESLIKRQTQKAVIHGLSNGLIIEDKSDLDKFKILPITLLPSPFPSSLYQLGLQLGVLYNSLYFKIANDHEFIEQSLKNLVAQDPFYCGLWRIYERVRSQPQRQTIQLNINRSDYMVPSFEDPCLKQIEINMISVSFGGLVERCANTNSFVLKKLKVEESGVKMSPRREIALGLTEAHRLYNKKHQSNCVILFIVTKIKYNQVDQYFIEFEIDQIDSGIIVQHATLDDINTRGCLGDNFELLFDGREVSVVYFRTGYTTSLIATDEEWEGRLLLERSRAIKCPSLNFQLAGTKRIQQLLSDRRILSRFVADETDLNLLISSMVGQFSLTDSENSEIIQQAIKYPNKYVLKSQLEGGGNNIFGQDIVDKLNSGEDRSIYTLMERIYPFTHKNIILRGLKKPNHPQDLVSEYSFFGIIISDGDTIVRNTSFGHIVRSKEFTDSEGGITSGSGCLSSVYLI